VRKKIRVFGGDQLRPNLNIRDMVRAYDLLLTAPPSRFRHETFNIGYQNLKVRQIAELVYKVVGDSTVEISFEPTDDHRSYHVNSDRARAKLGFEPAFSVEDAIQSLCDAHKSGQIPRALEDPLYYNIRTMQQVRLATTGELKSGVRHQN